jgi:hypothetical protein
MAKSKSKALPRFGSLDKLVEFFDTHDMGDYWDRLPKADFDVNVRTRKHLVAIDKGLLPRLDEIAKSKRVPTQKLINVWLREKIETTKRA